jgi:predicted nucleic acid-binding protein
MIGTNSRSYSRRKESNGAFPRLKHLHLRLLQAWSSSNREGKSHEGLVEKNINDVLDGKEEVLSTVVHISEVANILKHSLGTTEIADIIEGIFALDNVQVAGVDKDEYLAATELGKELEMDPNDSLAYQVMRSNRLFEIYSYDKVFERVEGLRRLPN